MTKKEETELRYYYITETMWESILADAWMLVVCALVFGPGVIVGSSAMQWLGFIMFFVWALGRSKTRRMSPQELADKLLREHGVTGRR